MEENLILTRAENSTESSNPFDDPRTWGPGPWIGEPGVGHEEWYHYKDYICVIKRQFSGNWCGYVHVPMTSPFFKKVKEAENDWDIEIEVHGSITYSGKTLPWEKKGPKKGLWIGFDTSHSDDIWPLYEAQMEFMKEKLPDIIKDLNKITGEIREMFPMIKTYKTLQFVRDECKSMIDQIVGYKE